MKTRSELSIAADWLVILALTLFVAFGLTGCAFRYSSRDGFDASFSADGKDIKRVIGIFSMNHNTHPTLDQLKAKAFMEDAPSASPFKPLEPKPSDTPLTKGPHERVLVPPSPAPVLVVNK